MYICASERDAVDGICEWNLIYIYVYTHVCIHIMCQRETCNIRWLGIEPFIYINITHSHICTHAHVHTNIYIYIHVYAPAREMRLTALGIKSLVYVYIYIYKYIYYIHINIYTYKYIYYIYINIYIYIFAPAREVQLTIIGDRASHPCRSRCRGVWGCRIKGSAGLASHVHVVRVSLSACVRPSRPVLDLTPLSCTNTQGSCN